jgi:hypothetical protein
MADYRSAERKRNGIEPGAPVIVSDLVPAIEGMRLEGQPDPEVLERLIADAEGRE